MSTDEADATLAGTADLISAFGRDNTIITRVEFSRAESAAGDRPQVSPHVHPLLWFEVAGFTPDVQHLRLQPRDQLLLCTDGLTDRVTQYRILLHHTAV